MITIHTNHDIFDAPWVEDSKVEVVEDNALFGVGDDADA